MLHQTARNINTETITLILIITPGQKLISATLKSLIMNIGAFIFEIPDRVTRTERTRRMPRVAIIQPDQSYTFADYFKLNFAPQDILAYFGVTLQRRSLQLPQYPGTLDRLIDLKARIEESLPRLSLTSEMARREFLIAPVLTDLLHYTQATLNVEYPVAVNRF